MVQIGKDPTDPAHWTQIAQQIAFCSSMKPEEDKTPLHRDTRQRAYHENIEGKGTDKSRKRRKVRSKDAVYVEKFAEEAALSNDCAAILDEYRVKNHMPELKDVQCHIIEFAYNQFGSRLLQEKLDTASEEEKAIIYDTLLESKEFNRLMKDGFGNYVLQRMFENGSASQHLAIVDRLTGNVFDYATHPYGCRVIQKGLECVTVDQQIRLVKDLQSPKNVLTCVQNQNGNHVIQKCIERMPVEHIQFVVDALKGHAEELAQNAFGCRVLQRLIEHCTDAEKVSPLLDEILRSVDQMAQDQYGNYVLQHILEHGVEDNRQTIMNVITTNILELSCHKFSSNVVESAILRCSTDESIRVSQAIMGDPSDTNPPLLTMMRDRYGNYIIQRLLESSLSSHREMLLHRLKDQLHQLRKFTYSKHIVQVVEDWLRENPNVTTQKKTSFLSTESPRTSCVSDGNTLTLERRHVSRSTGEFLSPLQFSLKQDQLEVALAGRKPIAVMIEEKILAEDYIERLFPYNGSETHDERRNEWENLRETPFLLLLRSFIRDRKNANANS